MLLEHTRHIPNERETLVDALQQTNWNKAEAARLLNMSRMSIYRKISKYHIVSSPEFTD